MSNSRMSTQIALEGEKEYRDAAKAINNSLYDMGLEMKKVTATFSDNQKSTEALTAQNEVLGREYEERQKKIDALKKVLGDLENQEEKNEDAIRNYRNELTKEETALINTENQIKKNTDQIGANEDAAKKLAGEADDLAESTEQTGEAAEVAGEKHEKLKKIFGAVGDAIKAFAATAAAAGAALAALTIDASNTADDLLTQSQITRQSTDDLQKYAYAARFVDVEVDTITGTMTKNIKAMQSAREGTGDIAEAYAKLGIAVTDADGNLRDSNDVYWETIDALGAITNETERDALSMSILGKSASELNPLINAGSEAFKAYGEEAEKMGVVMSGDQIDALGAFNDQVQKVEAGFGGLKNAASMIALPFLDVLAGEGIDILAEFTRGVSEAGGDMSKISDVVGNTLGTIISTISEQAPKLLEMGVQLIQAIINGIAKNAPALATAAVGIITTLIKGIISALPVLISGAVSIVKELAAALKEQLPELIPIAIEALLTLVTAIIENIPVIIDAALMIIEGLVKGIINALPILIAALPALIKAIIDAIVTGIPLIVESAGKIIMALVSGIIAALPQLIEALPEIITSIVTGLMALHAELLEVGIKLLVSIIDGIISAIPQLVSEIPEIIDELIKGFGDGLNKMFEVGGNLIKGLWDGLVDGWNNLKDKTSEIGGQIVDGFKDFFGIHSPSTVFADMGDNMAAGVGVGFEREMKKVADEMQEAIPTDFDADATVNVNTVRNGGAGYSNREYDGSGAAARISVVQNIYTEQYDYNKQQEAAALELSRVVGAIGG